MTAEEWIAAYAAALGAEAPSPEEVERILRLASVAAHGSERVAAPLACWLGARSGLPSDLLVRLAEDVGR